MEPNDIWKFIVKNKAYFIILIPLFFSVFLRIQPAYLPVTDQWAANSVQSSYMSQIEAQINQQYPNLPAQNKQGLINSEYQKLLDAQGDTLEQQTVELSDYFRSKFQDDSGQTYLLAIDPWLWYGITRNYATHGMAGDEIVDGEMRYSLRGGRLGRPQGNNIHSYFMYLVYKVWNIFDDVSVMKAVFYLPLIICTLAVIPGYFLGRRLGGEFGGFFAAMIVAVHSAVLGRTPAGFSDTDAYSLLFPLLIVWMFVEAYRSDITKNKLIYVGLGAFFSSIYAILWSGFFYLVVLLVAAPLFVVARLIILDWKEIKKQGKKYFQKHKAFTGLAFSFYYIGAIVIFFLIVKTLLSGANLLQLVQEILNAIFIQPVSYLTYKSVAVKSIWPNVLTTVAELNVVSVKNVINGLGGLAVFWIASCGSLLLVVNRKLDNMYKILYVIGSAIFLLVIMKIQSILTNHFLFLALLVLPVVLGLFLDFKNEKTDERNTFYAMLLILWLGGTTYTGTQGVRFVALAVPAFALGYGAFVGISHKVVSEYISKSFQISKNIIGITLIVLMCLLLITPVRTAYATAINEVPSMTDAWYDSLTEIRDTSDDAIITSWWDFGHWFVAVAQRRVTFDGGDQGKRIHWVGKTLLTEDEGQASDILRMLNCGQSEGVNVLEDDLGKTQQYKFVTLIYDILPMDGPEALDYLTANGIPAATAEKVIEYTHCEDLIDQYYIASEDMIGKSGVWAHFGSWNFTRGSMYNRVNSLGYEQGMEILQNDFGLTESEADKIYYEIKTADPDQWVSGWPSYASGETGCSVSGQSISCGNGVVFDIAKQEAYVNTDGGKANLKSISFINNESEFTVVEFTGNTIDFSAALYIREGRYYSILMKPDLVASMFTRLYFFEGAGLKYFEPFSHRTTVTGLDIYVYKVNWNNE